MLCTAGTKDYDVASLKSSVFESVIIPYDDTTHAARGTPYLIRYAVRHGTVPYGIGQIDNKTQRLESLKILQFMRLQLCKFATSAN